MRKTALIQIQGRVLALKPIPMGLAFSMAKLGIERGKTPTPDQLRQAMPVMRDVTLSCLPNVSGIYEGTFDEFLEENNVSVQDVLDLVVQSNPEVTDLDQLSLMVDEAIKEMVPSAKCMIFVGDMGFEAMSEIISKASKGLTG